mmetsp:Transcript_265/g.350  ORF Transcript_265/g.350 Transcript_265/m.350 type:complete len:432 (+) Transcript_265:126-1421(+)
MDSPRSPGRAPDQDAPSRDGLGQPVQVGLGLQASADKGEGNRQPDSVHVDVAECARREPQPVHGGRPTGQSDRVRTPSGDVSLGAKVGLNTWVEEFWNGAPAAAPSQHLSIEDGSEAEGHGATTTADTGNLQTTTPLDHTSATEPRLCRICFEEEPTNFIAPCRCSGSSAWVHRKCLDLWRQKAMSTDAMTKCNTCQFEYILREQPRKSLGCLLSLLDVGGTFLLMVGVFLAVLFVGNNPPAIYDFVFAAIGVLTFTRYGMGWVAEHGVLSWRTNIVYAGSFSAGLFCMASLGNNGIWFGLKYGVLFFLQWNGLHFCLSFYLWVLRKIRERLRSVNLSQVVCLATHPECRPAPSTPTSSSSSSSEIAPEHISEMNIEAQLGDVAVETDARSGLQGPKHPSQDESGSSPDRGAPSQPQGATSRPGVYQAVIV